MTDLLAEICYSPTDPRLTINYDPDRGVVEWHFESAGEEDDDEEDSGEIAVPVALRDEADIVF